MWAFINFYPRPPWGGRPFKGAAATTTVCISIHALRGEGDALSRLSVRPKGISIHALRGEGDLPQCGPGLRRFYFYPRPPWGGRRPAPCCTKQFFLISIHALRGEGDQWFFAVHLLPRIISIHALRGEGDACSSRRWSASVYFYPRPPWGGRPCISCSTWSNSHISIHALRGEGDGRPAFTSAASRNIFLSTPSVGRATALSLPGRHTWTYFYPRPPWGGRLTAFLSCVTRLSYFYPRPPWGGRRLKAIHSPKPTCISIHALRGEGDAWPGKSGTAR